MGWTDNIPFINRNRASRPKVVTPDRNSYDDSVAAALQRHSNVSVTVEGRPLGIQYNDEQIEQIYQGYVFGAIRKLANKTAEVLAEHFETLADGEETDLVHPYLTAVDNSNMDNRQFWQGVATYVIILGEAFVFTGERLMQAGNVKPVEAFTLLQSNRVKRYYNDDGSIRAYRQKYKKAGMQIDVDNWYLPNNVIAVTDFNPWEMGKGYGLIRPILDKIGLESQATHLQSSTMGNTIKAPGILAAQDPKGGEMDPRLFAELEEKVRARWTSNDMDRAGTPIVSNGGALTWETIDQDWEKLAMKSIREMNRDSFFAALGVSKTILGIEQSGVTRDTSRTMTENFILDMVMPLAGSIISAFNQDYINNYPMDFEQRKLKIALEAPIEKDLEAEKAQADIEVAKANAFKTYHDAGLSNEAAAKLVGIDDILTALTEVDTTETTTPATEATPAASPPPTTPATVIHNHVHNHAAPPVPEAVVNSLPKKSQRELIAAKKELEAKIRDLDGSLGEAYLTGIQTNDFGEDVDKNAKWSTAYVNDLPDSAFLYVGPGGNKDETGKTVPRRLRYFPYKDQNGNVDLPHLRNALTRIGRSKLSDAIKEKLTAKAKKLLADAKASSNAATQAQQTQYQQDLAAAIVAYYVVAGDHYGPSRYAELIAEFGAKAAQGVAKAFELTAALKTEFANRAKTVATAHFDTLDKTLKSTIEQGIKDGLGREEIQKLVKSKVDEEVKGWQVERLVNTEVANAYRQSQYQADLQYLDHTKQTDQAYKIWVNNGPDPCVFCRSLAGTRVKFNEPFFKVGDTVEANDVTADGKPKQVYYNIKHHDINAGEIHPNGHCGYRLEIA